MYHISENKCKECGGDIIIKQSRDKKNKFCSLICYNKNRKNHNVVVFDKEQICLSCGKSFKPTRRSKGLYCSYKCSNGAKSVNYQLKCNFCKRTFNVNNIAEIKRGNYKFCSVECAKRQFSINENYFESLDDEKYYWLGFIWASTNSFNSRILDLVSNKDLLERFSSVISSTYKVQKYFDKYRLNINSRKILNRLVDIGLNKDFEFPNILDRYKPHFIRGYFDSHMGYHYVDNGIDIIVIYGKHKKLMLYISDYLDTNLKFNKGEWFIITNNFPVFGKPFLEKKWNKFKKK